MVLLGQTFGQTPICSACWALESYLNARGITKHPLQSSAKVPGAQQRRLLFQEIAYEQPVHQSQRQGYLEVAGKGHSSIRITVLVQPQTSLLCFGCHGISGKY